MLAHGCQLLLIRLGIGLHQIHHLTGLPEHEDVDVGESDGALDCVAAMPIDDASVHQSQQALGIPLTDRDGPDLLDSTLLT